MNKELVYLEIIKKYFSEKPKIIDIGGFKGNWANMVIEVIKFDRIFIFEPNSENFECLQEKFHNFKNIELINKGVGEENSKRTYFDLKSHDGAREMSGFVEREIYKNYEYEKLEFEVVNLDSLDISNESFDFIKIDVEGYELNVLNGMKNMLSNSNPKFIQFEYGGTYLDAGYKLSDVVSFLDDFGYKVYDLDEKGNLKRLDLIENFEYNVYIATKKPIIEIWKNI